MIKQLAVLILATLTLSACSSTPQHKLESASANTSATGGYLPGDGPGAENTVDLDAIPDAVPKNEPLHRYANRPYIALGKTYKPRTSVGNFRQRGIASWYGKKFHGQRTSSGEVYDMYAMTAAHPTLPIPSYVRVTNLANQKSVIVRINDRGPFLHDRVIDVSYAAAHKLDIIAKGSGEVEVESLVANASAVNAAAEESQKKQQPDVASAAAPSRAALAPLESTESSVYLQLGAFKSQEGAESFMERMRNDLGNLGKEFKMSAKDGLVRVHIGPYGSRSEARANAESMKSTLGFRPMVNLP